jgi:hypothetical protein
MPPLVSPVLSEALEDSENGLLSNVLRLLSRPGFAARSLLSGEIGDAAENVAQMFMDLPTGGFLDKRLSLANLFDDDGDITDKKERPEFTDLVQRFGGGSASSRSFGENLALDLVGGTLTDPLTLVSGPIRSVFGKTLANLPRRAQGALLADALRQTPDGTKALASASDEVLDMLKGRQHQVRGHIGPKFDENLEPLMQPTRLAKRLASGEPLSPRYRARLDRLVENLAAEKVLGSPLGDSPAFTQAVTNLREFEDVFKTPVKMQDAAPAYRSAIDAVEAARVQQIADLDEGLDTLRTAGLLGAGRGIRFAGYDLPNAWVNTGRFGTLPGLVREGLLTFDKTKPVVEAMDTAAEASWDYLRGAFIDRKAAGKAPEALKYLAREIDAKNVADDRRVDRVSQEILGGVDDVGLERFGKTLARYENDYNEALFNVSSTNVLADGTPGPALKFPDPDEALARFTAEVAEIPGMRPDTVRRWVSEMEQVKRDNLKSGFWKNVVGKPPEGLTKEQWEKISNSPFYLPHQIAPTFSALLGESFKNKNLADEVRDIFQARRGYRTAEDFSRALDATAAKYGINVEGLSDLQDFNAASLFRKRLFAHNRTMARAKLMGEARRLGMVEGSPLAEYVKAQIQPVGRESIDFMPARKLSQFLGGGKFNVDVSTSPRLQEWIKSRETLKDPVIAMRLRKEPNGRTFAQIDWPGLNTFWKAPLTVASGPAYHFRNTSSAVAGGAFDPDIGIASGARAVKGMFYSALRSPLVKRFADMGLQPNEIADAVELLHHDPGVRAAAVQKLMATGKTVGKYSWDEVARILDGAIPAYQNVADIDRAIGRIDAFGRELNAGWDEVLSGKAGNRFVGAVRKIVQLGTDISNASEQHFRVSAMVDMLRKGVDPVEATRRMQRVMVNYNANSNAERFARDLIPFLRYTLGSTQWLSSIASNPRLVNWMGRVQGSAENTLGDQGPLPARASETLAIPLPWKDAQGNVMFLTSLGLPQEVAINALGLATPSGFRRQILGGITPAVRLPFEAAVGKSMYFNEEFGAYRKAPSWLPDALTTEIKLPDGTVRREIPGNINEILNALPISRIEGLVDSALNENKSAWTTLVNFATGARIMSIDQEKELKRRLADFLKTEADKGTVGQHIAWFGRLDKESMPPEVEAALKAIQPKRRSRALVSAE